MTLRELYSDRVGILILDYAKPKETEVCLRSVKKHCKFNSHVILYSNGGEQDYIKEFYDEGLIDQLVLSKKNVGCGAATIELFQLCPTPYAIYLQNDQYFCNDLTQKELNLLISYINQNYTVKSISLAGLPCGPDIYSERAHLISVDFYNNIVGKTVGGPGPLNDIKYSEESIQDYYKVNNYVHKAITPIVADNGVFSIRELAGGVLKWRTDTKQLWVIDKPQGKIEHLKLTDEEWSQIFNGTWENGSIPNSWLNDSFKCWE